MDNFQKLLFTWSEYDNKLKELNKHSTEIRKNKENISKQIIPFITKNKLEDNVFKIPSLNVDIVCKENHNYQSISYKFLEERFNEYFTTKDEVTKLMQFLKDNRKKESSLVLKSNYTEGIEDE